MIPVRNPFFRKMELVTDCRYILGFLAVVSDFDLLDKESAILRDIAVFMVPNMTMYGVFFLYSIFSQTTDREIPRG